jgi:phosphotransacetylase
MARIGFSDNNEYIREAAERLKRETEHTPVIYDNLTESLNSLINGNVDCLVGGHDISTGDFLRGIIDIVKPEGRIYSYSVLAKNEEEFYFADTGVNVSPSIEQISELEGILDKELKPYLNYYERTRIGYKTDENTMQIDSAIDPLVAEKKGIKDSKRKNVFVFQDLSSANSAYKIMQRFGGYSHVGPVLLNTGYHISDLSRGADKEEIYNTAKYLGDMYGKRSERRN